jgi:hypothetical protein
MYLDLGKSIHKESIIRQNSNAKCNKYTVIPTETG